jgi:uncharacterized protein with HEPN domain
MVSEGFRLNHAEFPWRKVISRRNGLVHGFVDIKHEPFWRVATKRIPELNMVLEALMPQAPSA